MKNNDGRLNGPSQAEPVVSALRASVPDALLDPWGSAIEREGCDLCSDPDGGPPYYPMYGVAPHECYWRKGPQFQIGQSTINPFTPDDCFVPDLEDDEDWSAFGYPAACGTYYCPNCNRDAYERHWKCLVDRIGLPPEGIAQGMETRQGGNEVPSQSDDSPVACDAPHACSEDTSHDH